jgi:hypothetical protein
MPPIHPILAQVDLSLMPVQIGGWIACAAFMVMFLNQGAKFADRLRGKPGQPPNEVLETRGKSIERRLDKFEGKQESFEEKLEKEREDLAKELKEVNKENELRAEKLHKRINAMIGGMNRIIGAVGQLPCSGTHKCPELIEESDET